MKIQISNLAVTLRRLSRQSVRIFNVALNCAVITATVLSTVIPAVSNPVPVTFDEKSLSALKSKLEVVAFKLLLADEAQATKPEPVIDVPALIQREEVSTKEIAQGEKNDAKETAREKFRQFLSKQKELLQNAAYVAGLQSLDYFMQQLAYDTATFLASGGKGQQPMFYTEGWGEYLKNLADEAAGSFIEKLSGSWLGFGVCEPNISLKISIGLGLADLQRPRKPQCTAREMLNNWQSAVNDPDFLDRISIVFEPEQNDIGIAFSIFGQYYDNMLSEMYVGEKTREAAGGFKAIVSKISNIIKTPESLVKARSESLVQDPVKSEWQKVQFGDIFANAAGTFVNTLAGKLFQRIFEQGLVGDTDSNDSSNHLRDTLFGFLNGLRLPDRGTSLNTDTSVQGSLGSQAAQVRFIDLLQTGNKAQEKPYDVLTKLTFCADPENPGPDECVIRSDFRTAIVNKLTVQEAMDQGLIDGDLPFGIEYDGTALYRGIPLRSVTILRAFRVVPIGWEIAAQAINKFEKGERPTLRSLTQQYNDETSNYRGLVDPNWLLELPEHLCKAEGYGSKLIYSQVTGGADNNRDGDFNDPDDIQPQRLVGRTTYCADYQSCIEKNDDGSCKYYGYCQEDRRIWDLQGNSCPDYYNTCQTFENTNGDTVSYLQNSLDFNGCDVDNAGCRWYCTAYNPIDQVWTCDVETERVIKPCTQPGGCELIARCAVPNGDVLCNDSESQVNLLINPACGPGSKWWTDGGTSDPADDRCEVSTGCTILAGGVSCTTNGCENVPNLLLNPSFETRSQVAGVIAQNWTTSSGDLTYFRRVSGATENIYKGSNAVRFYNAGTAITERITSQPVTLDPSKTYTFSIWVYNRLIAGTITAIVDDGAGNTVEKQSTVKNSWEQLSFDFTGSPSTNVSVEITNNGGQVSGSAWIDDLRISESCVTNPVTLSLIGTIEQNESKIHLDRDASTCSSSDAGCSELIRLKPNLGSNLVPNGGFEDWDDPESAPAGWRIGENGLTDSSRETELTEFGNNSLKLVSTNTSAGLSCRRYETAPIVGMKENTMYRVSFWARSDSALPSSESNWYGEFLSAHDPDSFCSLDPNMECSPTNDPCSAEGKGICLADWEHLKINGVARLPLTPYWQHYVMDPIVSRISSADYKLSFNNCWTNDDTPIYIDNVHIEEVAVTNPIVSNYSDYGTANVVHLRQAPDSLGCTGNSSTDPSECALFAPVCSPAEVGCEAYQPIRGGQMIPAVVMASDFCPAECVGYEAYKQTPIFFESQETLDYFIPRTARQCSAAKVGCSEFTNLDEVSAGGEGKEYYQFMRLCEQTASPSCQNFYTWQGSEETGYQLRVYALSAESNVPSQAITDTTKWPDQWCDDKTLDSNGLPNCCNSAEDIIVNPFCKEFFGTNGAPSYRIYDNTISCSDNCHPYRKTRLGESDTDAQQNCEASYGAWQTQSNSCVYQAIPGQGVLCSAPDAGCREYRGNTGGNVFISFSDTFEDGETSGWQYGDISVEALSVGGHSLRSEVPADGLYHQVSTMAAGLSAVCSDTNLPACDATHTDNCFDQSLSRCIAREPITNQICYVQPGEQHCGSADLYFNEGKTYLLSFWAKSGSANPIDNVVIKILDAVNSPALEIGETIIDSDWHYYSFGPFTYSYSERFIGSSARLVMEVDGHSVGFFVDNIQVKEVIDLAFVIKNSWNTPASCDINPYVDPPASAPQFMLGCEQYRDSVGQLNNLKSFDTLCREEAVGCEALLDTHNSTSPFEERFNVNDPIADITVPGDNVTYLVNRSEYRCASEAKGCEAVGLAELNTDNEITGYETVYVINNPDQYDTTLCESEEVWCEEFESENGFSYFKDPRSKTCVYQKIPNGTAFGWFKTGSSSPTPDCPVVQPPVGTLHPDPARGWAGFCASEFSGCTEYIDPVTSIGTNRLFNGTLDIDVDEDDVPDGWDNTRTDTISQDVSLKQNTLYTFSFMAHVNDVRGTAGNGLSFTIRDCDGIVSFDHSMVYTDNDRTHMDISEDAYKNDNRTASLVDGIPNVRRYSARFTVPDAQTCSVRVTLSGGTSNGIKSKVKEIMLSEAGVYHSINDSVDNLSCNGVVNEELGCVLFNDRGQINYKIGEDDVSSLVFDADVSGAGVNDGLAVTSCAGNCDSNAILKVRPDRTCDSWLSCKTLGTFVDETGIDRTYCAALGQCDSLDESGNCNNVVAQRVEDDRFDVYTDRNQLKNKTGYTRPGLRFDYGVCSSDSIERDRGEICDKNSDCEDGRCEQTVKGNFPYAEMEQIGQSARVANGGFEFTVVDSTEPVGWNTVGAQEAYDSLLSSPTPNGKKYAPIEWFNYKFKVEKNFSNLIEGTSYLRLNTFYEAVSEQIDVEPGVDYTLSAQVNTQFLEYSGPTLPEAQILIKAFNSNNAVVEITDIDQGECFPDYFGWQKCTGAFVRSGLGWQRLNLKFRTPNDVTKVQLKLSNYISDDPGCIRAGRYVIDPGSACNLGGYSLFDDISMKPVLGIDKQPRYTARSCRLYPTVDALACNYLTDDSIFFGKYGYCVTTDPYNPSQCIQWWPLDQIDGETLDEVTSGYNDRMPLNYCTNQEDVNINVSANGMLLQVDLGNSGFDSSFGQFTSIIDSSSQKMKFTPFSINTDYSALFRYPYVQSFKVHGSISGASLMSGGGIDPAVFIPIPYGARMYKDHVCWKFIDFNITTLFGGDQNAQNKLANAGLTDGGILDRLLELLGGGSLIDGIGGLGGTSNRYWLPGSPGHETDDTRYDFCWQVKADEEWGGFGVLGLGISFPTGSGFSVGVVLGIPVPYNMAQALAVLGSFNVPLSQLIGAAAGAAGPVTAKVVTDDNKSSGSVVADPIPDIGGDILGAATQLLGSSQGAAVVIAPLRFDSNVPVKYCSEVVQVVTSAGTNKGYANRLTSGSGFQLEDFVNDQERHYKYLNPFDFRELIANKVCQNDPRHSLCTTDANCPGGSPGSCVNDPSWYYSSDYAPFGAVVAPSNSQYPTAWDSKSSQYRQPLLFEPPMTSSFTAPYQARMGEAHTADSLKQIFAKSYGIWHWQWADTVLNLPFDANHGGQYVEGASDPLVPIDWDLPTDPCPVSSVTNKQERGDNYCYIRPIIDVENIRVNDKRSTTLESGIGIVKLSFTIKVDPDQLPLTAYSVDWGDGNFTSVSGVVLRNRSNPENPFVLYHLYDYWQMLKAANRSGGSPSLNCPAGGSQCTTKVQVMAKDNWGAPSGDGTEAYIIMNGEVTVSKPR